MPTITKTNAIAFADSRDMAIADRGEFIYKKHRPTDINGVWKATEAYKVHMTESDIKELFKGYNGNFISAQEIIERYRNKGLLPKERLFISNDVWIWSFLTRDGFKDANMDAGDKNRTKEYYLIVFAYSDFVKLEPTKKEKETIVLLDKRSRMQKLNNLVVKDNIIKALNDKGYDCRCFINNTSMDNIGFNSKRGYNTLVKDAIEYYLNNIVLKELGCKMVVPKVKTTHSYGASDVLCYIGDIEIDEGEQNGRQES